MKVPSRSKEELVAIRTLLLAETNGLRWTRKKGESELVLRTEFLAVFPPDMIGLVVAHLHRTVGDECTDAEFVRCVAVILYVCRKAYAETGKCFGGV